MTVSSEKKEIKEVINRLLDNLALTVSSHTGKQGAELRRQIGDLRANYSKYLSDGSFADKLLGCFTAARTAGVTVASLAHVHNQLFEETPVGDIPMLIIQAAVVYCLSAESRLITATVFTSRTDIEAIMAAMKTAFDTAKDLVADMPDSASYQTLTFLAGSLTAYLASTARPLPRMIAFKLAKSLPALTLSNRIYYTGERWQEIIEENKTVHPAFCQRDIIGLSS